MHLLIIVRLHLLDASIQRDRVKLGIFKKRTRESKKYSVFKIIEKYFLLAFNLGFIFVFLCSVGLNLKKICIGKTFQFRILHQIEFSFRRCSFLPWLCSWFLGDHGPIIFIYIYKLSSSRKTVSNARVATSSGLVAPFPVSQRIIFLGLTIVN